MTDALLRNVYGDDPAMRSHADTLARYVKRCALRVTRPQVGQTAISVHSQMTFSEPCGGPCVQGTRVLEDDAHRRCHEGPHPVFARCFVTDCRLQNPDLEFTKSIRARVSRSTSRQGTSTKCLAIKTLLALCLQMLPETSVGPSTLLQRTGADGCPRCQCRQLGNIALSAAVACGTRGA